MAAVCDTTFYHYDMMDCDILPSPDSLPPPSYNDVVSPLPSDDNDDEDVRCSDVSPLPSDDNDDEDVVGSDVSPLLSDDNDDEDVRCSDVSPLLSDDNDDEDVRCSDVSPLLSDDDEDVLDESPLPSDNDDEVTVASTNRIETRSTNYTDHSVFALIRIDSSRLMVYYRSLKIRKEMSELQQSCRLSAEEDRWRSKFINDIKEHFPSARLLGYATKGNNMLEVRSHVESEAMLGANAKLRGFESPVTGEVKKMYEIPRPEVTDESLLKGMMDIRGECKFENYYTKMIYDLPSKTVVGQTRSDVDAGTSTSDRCISPSLENVPSQHHGDAQDRQRRSHTRKRRSATQVAIEKAGTDPKQPKIDDFYSRSRRN